VRRPGGGRKRISQRDPTVVSDLEKLVEPVTRGSGISLRWTCKSVRRLAQELARQGHPISYPVVAQLLDEWATAGRPTARPRKGAPSPTAMPQFEYINRKVKRFLADKQPVLSVDTKKKGTGRRLKE